MQQVFSAIKFSLGIVSFCLGSVFESNALLAIAIGCIILHAKDEVVCAIKENRKP